MIIARMICTFGFIAMSVACATPSSAPESYDVILRGGVVYDGTGSPGAVADVAIRGDRITAVGDIDDATAQVELDVSGLAVAPGFINMLSWGVKSLLADGRGLSDISQGVTLEVFGEGWSMGPLPENREWLMSNLIGDLKAKYDWQTLGEYLELLEDQGVSPNVASFVGATTLRIHEVGFDNRPPTAAELDNMRALARHAMEEGALGLGTSLIYPPAFYANTEELVELAKVAREYDGMYISHMRSEANQILEAIDEVITIAREANIPAEIYHLKLAGADNWPKLDAVIDKIESARAEGLKITADMYVYRAGATDLSATMPPWAKDGGSEAFLNRLRDPVTRARIVKEMGEKTNEWENLYQLSGPDGILLASVQPESFNDLQGKTLAQVAAERNRDPRETVADLLLEGASITAVYYLASEDNIVTQIALPWVSFGSDGDATAPDLPDGVGGQHPRSYGNVPRLLGRYVRDQKLIPLEEAIRKLTSQPASNLKLKNRGKVSPGYFADITVFDPKTIQDHATYENPQQLSTGVVHVFVNGEQVLANGEHTGAKPGRAIRGPGWTGER